MVTDSVHLDALVNPKGTHPMTREEIKEALEGLENDPKMITTSFYSPLAIEWPDNRFPFVEFHLNHLLSHKLTNPETYLSNLRLMIKKR